MKHYNTEHLTFVIRQYATFIYIIIAYFLANKFFTSKDRVNLAIRFIYLFSKVSVVVQSVFLIISLMTGYSNNTAVEGHRYISPIVVLGVITYGAYVIVYKEKLLFKLVSVILTFILLFSTGHASAFLSFLVILLFNFFLKINIKQRVIGIVVVILLIMFLYAFPQFRDVNASWRLIYWGHVINNIFLENFSLFGNGFGEPYSTYEFAIGLNKTHNSYVLANTYKPYSRWLIGPHNSFLTIMFHIGFLPTLLLFLPVIRIFKKLFYTAKFNNDLKFLMMSFLGLSIWVAFNVILELPHSSLYFWLLFFTLSYYYKYCYILEK